MDSVGLCRSRQCDCTLLQMMYLAEVDGTLPRPLLKKIPEGTLLGDDEPFPEGLTLQSASLPMGDDVVEDNKSSESTSQQVNVSFSDENSGEKLSMPTDISYLMSTSAENVDLGKFLERPVLIATEQWAEGTSFTASRLPWLDVLGNQVMRRKLENFFLMRANLNIKVVVNASPFYYGAVLVSYTPLPFFAQDTAGDPLVPLSQRPHFYIYPQTSQGGEMKIPFLYYKEWLDITTNADLTAMGVLNFNAITPLRNANNAVGQNVTIKTYAWFSEVELDGTTEKLVLQSGKAPMKDEYSKEGAISKPASAIARASGSLSDLPVVGPFMTATSVAANAVANVASLFGFTDVPVVADVHSFKNTPFPQMATTDVGVQFEKLSLDAKNELTIDPKVCGVDASDEMQISSIVQRESYLTTFPWASSDASDKHLFTMRVAPTIRRVTATTGSSRINFTPMGYLAEAFTLWRGDIKVRLKFICSQYHRGRVLVTWDPVGSPSSTVDTATEVYSQIVDLAESTDVEFNIPYIQPQAYIRTDTPNPAAQGFSTTAFTTNNDLSNGNLSIFVLNELTSPSVTADIDVAVFIRGGDNMEFANPRDINPLYSPYTIQSGSTPMDKSSSICYDIKKDEQNIGGKKSVTDSNLNLVYNGESVVSLRQMIRRSNYYSYTPFSMPITANAELVLNEVILPRLPLYPGYDTSGIQLARNNAGTANVAYNWVNWSYLSWFSLMYVGVRGSVNYMVNKESSRNTDTVFIERSVNPDRGSIPTFNTFVVSTTANTTDDMARLMSVFRQSGESGLAVTNQQTQSSLLASVPYYSRYKFSYTNPLFRTDGTSIEDSDRDSIIVGTTVHISQAQKGAYTMYQAYDLFISAGTDMSFVFFLSAPTMTLYDATPGAPA